MIGSILAMSSCFYFGSVLAMSSCFALINTILQELDET